LSAARAWRPTVGANLARTLGITFQPPWQSTAEYSLALPNSNPMIKIFVDQEAESDGIPLATESLNAREVDSGVFELRNSSILRSDLAYGDLVEALPDERGNLWFDRHVQRSGYSVIRAAIASEHTENFFEVMEQLQADGAGVTASTSEGIAFGTVTLPPEMNLAEVASKLTRQLGTACIVRILAARSQTPSDTPPGDA
jgi:hypothetical protein